MKRKAHILKRARWLSPEGMECRETMSDIMQELWDSHEGQMAKLRLKRLMGRKFYPTTNYVEQRIRRIVGQ